MTMTRANYRDALGWLRLTLQQDWQVRDELAMVTDPAGLVDALGDMLLGLAAISTNGHPERYLDAMSLNLEQLLDRYDLPEDNDDEETK